MSQKENIKKHLIRYGRINPLEALNNYGCMRLAEYIRQLRNDGLDIETTYPKTGKKYGIYKLNQLEIF